MQDIGGNDIQKQEIKEAVELPLTHHELYRQIGIDPPRGVLLWGPPGTGKTMLAKAVAHHTTAAFIRVVGSEFVQKYLGEVVSLLRQLVCDLLIISSSECKRERKQSLYRTTYMPRTALCSLLKPWPKS